MGCNVPSFLKEASKKVWEECNFCRCPERGSTCLFYVPLLSPRRVTARRAVPWGGRPGCQWTWVSGTARGPGAVAGTTRARRRPPARSRRRSRLAQVSGISVPQVVSWRGPDFASHVRGGGAGVQRCGEYAYARTRFHCHTGGNASAVARSVGECLARRSLKARSRRNGWGL